ncbi:MAG: hypothetical protein KF729_12695 [Sandaracinaceae bacterium]|nr:hypothetical protein [Sandaracinaceae bacterium]
MTPRDLQSWFDEIEERAWGAAAERDMGRRFYPADAALQWVADAESALYQVFPDRHPIRMQWAERLAQANGQAWLIREDERMEALRAVFRSEGAVTFWDAELMRRSWDS